MWVTRQPANRRRPTTTKNTERAREITRGSESMRVVDISRPVQMLVIWLTMHCGASYELK